MKPVFSVEELVMHRGKMSLLDSIVDYGDNWLSAEVEINRNSMFADEHGVPGWVGMEYLAQAIGAYEGARQRLQGDIPKLGFLVGSRKYSCSVDYFEFDLVLSLYVECEMQSDNGLGVFRCILTGDGVEASANLNIFQPENAEVFLKGVTV